MNTKILYLVLALAGAIVPYFFFLQHFGEAGFSPQAFVSALFVNGAAGGFSTDLLISSLVFWIAMFEFRSRNGWPAPWPFIVVNLLIGLSCALPMYLYARQASRATASTSP